MVDPLQFLQAKFIFLHQKHSYFLMFESENYKDLTSYLKNKIFSTQITLQLLNYVFDQSFILTAHALLHSHIMFLLCVCHMSVLS